jgi:hypothetical protein
MFSIIDDEFTSFGFQTLVFTAQIVRNFEQIISSYHQINVSVDNS